MNYDTESPQLDDDLYDVAESLQSYIQTTIQAYNDIHMQSRFRLYSSRKTNYPGRVGKLAFHNNDAGSRRCRWASCQDTCQELQVGWPRGLR